VEFLKEDFVNLKNKRPAMMALFVLWTCCVAMFAVLEFLLGVWVTPDRLLWVMVAIGVILCGIMFGFVTRRIIFMGNQLKHLREEITAQQAKLFADDQIPDRTTVNAALIKLTEAQGDDPESVGIIIRFASRMLPVENDAQEHVDHTPSGGSFRGLTAEMGEMEFRQDKPEPEVISHGFHRERIGQFILTRTLDALVYRHHHKGTQATAGRPEDLAQGHVVIFTTDKMEYVGFANIALVRPSEDSDLFAIVAEIVHGQHKGRSFQIPTEI
jgi:hypothetical protein